MALTSATVIAAFSAIQSSANPLDGGGRFAPQLRQTLTYAAGTGAGQADILYAATRAVGDGANDDIDLAGVLSDVFGATIAAAELAALLVINAPISGAANTTDLTIGAGTNPYLGFLGGTTPTIGPLKPGAAFLIAAGDAAGIGAVVAGTGDILRVANSAGAAATYQIGILARSA